MKMKKKKKKNDPINIEPQKKRREWNAFEIIGLLIGILSIIATFVVLPWWKNYDKPVVTIRDIALSRAKIQ